MAAKTGRRLSGNVAEVRRARLHSQARYSYPVKTMLATLPHLQPSDFPRISRIALETLQVNLGYRCNQQCLHCHVNAGPKRRESMSEETLADVHAYLERRRPSKLDLTGGAPELHPKFRELVEYARALGVHVMDRCNLTVLEEPEQADCAEFLAGHGVEINASLPCYLSENVDGQRGKGVFEASMRALRRLNELGYASPGGDLRLNLVYNPQGPSLPPPQDGLAEAYRRHLRDEFGVHFNHLYTITNMPIQRFGSMLLSKGEFGGYMDLLRGAFSEKNLDGVMCRGLLSVDWRGFVYDCDFNQMLGLPLGVGEPGPVHLRELLDVDLEGASITVADHCYGCTAGQGSSCGGALV